MGRRVRSAPAMLLTSRPDTMRGRWVTKRVWLLTSAARRTTRRGSKPRGKTKSGTETRTLLTDVRRRRDWKTADLTLQVGAFRDGTVFDGPSLDAASSSG